MSDCAKCHTPLPLDGRFCSKCGTPTSEAHVCPPGMMDELRRRLARELEGRYEITRLLGRGGMAVVFLAEDLVLERQVAIKVLPPDMTGDGQLVARFQQEAKTAAKLDHPNIIPIYRVENEAGLVYFVMKYVSGHSLEDLLAQGPLPFDQVRHVLREAALALGHAHGRRVVHRDVKPANIMLDSDNRVILTDFGISKAAHGSSGLTGTGKIIGTPHYMAPEQAKGHEVDGRADQYALAIVGHRILTGKLPFEGEAHSILYQQVFELPPSVLELRPDTPHDLRVALHRALAKDPAERFPTMEEFAAAVRGEQSSSIPVHLPTTSQSRGGRGVDLGKPPATTVVSKPVAPAATHGAGLMVVLATVAAVVAAGWFGLPRLQAAAERRAADRAAEAARVVTPAPAPTPRGGARPVRRRAVAPVATVQRQAEKRRSPAKLRSVQHALLTVDSDPWGVLYVDGVEIGLTPVTNHRLSSGTHRLRIVQKGYQTITEAVVVKSTAPISRRYRLQPSRGR